MSPKVIVGGKAYTQATLCLLLRGHPTRQVLLGYKKTGFGNGKYTGIGGKVEAGEGITIAAARELHEETGVRVALSDLCDAGQLAFWFPNQPQWSQFVHIYTATKWVGEPEESDEMTPAWFREDQIPFERMWQDAAHWLPPVLAGRWVRADFVFQGDNESIQDVHLSLKERT